MRPAPLFGAVLGTLMAVSSIGGLVVEPAAARHVPLCEDVPDPLHGTACAVDCLIDTPVKRWPACAGVERPDP